MTRLRYSSIPPDAPYASQWRSYRTRQRLAIAAFVASCTLVILCFVFEWFYLAVGILFLSVLVFGNYAAFSPCPRCGRPFHIDYGRRSNPGAKQCVHCGLPRWSPGDCIVTAGSVTELSASPFVPTCVRQGAPLRLM